MYQNYDAVKLLIEERHREQLNIRLALNQLNGGKSSRNKSWITGQIGEYLVGLTSSIFRSQLHGKPIRSTEIGVEFTECQTTSDCQPC
jgi:hypothetical protein